ncbi:MAG: HipA domain-containing protein [Coriobacteriia bacterium]|nr:HipA domain-containing protein [Coriobacteriia bacterium]
MSARHISELAVYIGQNRCGILSQASTGALAFRYDSGYDGVPLSLSMPVGLAEYGDRIVRPYLMGLLPDEGATRAAIGAKYGVSGENPFKLLAHIGGDCPGAVRVLPLDDKWEKGGLGALVELSDFDIARLLADMQSSAAAAWTGKDASEGRWSLGGCQAKIALCRIDGCWYRCEGSSPTTHILKPGVSGLENQALVEYLSMRIAESIGMPVAHTSFERFGDEWAIVVERYDRVRNEEGVERVHQEDLCQALGVSPLCKYADQGGPNTPRIISLLRSTGAASRSNAYRFILYLFFNYLIGATDAHAKNHSLVYPSVGDIRLAPLYDVASIAAYQSLSPRPRKPLRAALSIGGENRFGHVGAEQVEKMVDNCGLGEIGLNADMLVGRFRTMAEMIPPAVEAEVDHALAAGFPGAHEVGEPMKIEIAENCSRTLRRLV